MAGLFWGPYSSTETLHTGEAQYLILDDDVLLPVSAWAIPSSRSGFISSTPGLLQSPGEFSISKNGEKIGGIGNSPAFFSPLPVREVPSSPPVSPPSSSRAVFQGLFPRPSTWSSRELLKYPQWGFAPRTLPSPLFFSIPPRFLNSLLDFREEIRHHMCRCPQRIRNIYIFHPTGELQLKIPSCWSLE